MEIKLKSLIFILFVILFSSCSAMHVNRYSSIGIYPEVRKEMIKAEKCIRKQERIIDKVHKKRNRKYNKLQKNHYGNKRW